MASPNASSCNVRVLKNKAREAAYMFRDGYLSSKAYQRRRCRMEKLRSERFRRPGAWRVDWERYGEARPCVEATESPAGEVTPDEESWSLMHYERLLEDETEMLATYLDDEETVVWCPLCEKGLLACPDSGRYSCPYCGADLPRRPGEGLEHLEVRILQALEEHELRCHGRPQFLLTPAELDDVSLLLVCDCCCRSCDVSNSELSL